jgi:hypothetical protein
MKSVRFAFLLLIACLMLTSCDRLEAFRQTQALAQAGRAYKASLLRVIQQSQKIVVTEHASSFETGTEKPVVYVLRELSPGQIAQLAKIVDGLSPDARRGEPLCIFDGHHTMKFYRANAIPEQMDICFACGQIEWSGAAGKAPIALVDGLARFVETIGMSAKRDWAALAKEHAK